MRNRRVTAMKIVYEYENENGNDYAPETVARTFLSVPAC
jgi:hypothetical protein